MDARSGQRRSRPEALERRAAPQRTDRVIASAKEFADALEMRPHPYLQAVYLAMSTTSSSSEFVPLRTIRTGGPSPPSRDYSPRNLFKRQVEALQASGKDLPIVLEGSGLAPAPDWQIENPLAPRFPFPAAHLRDKREALDRLFCAPLWYREAAEQFIRSLPPPSQVGDWSKAFELARRIGPLVVDVEAQLMLARWEITAANLLATAVASAHAASRSQKQRRHINWIACAQTLFYMVLAKRATRTDKNAELPIVTLLRDAIVSTRE